MTTTLKSYLDIILIERDWSWTLIGILYLVIGLVVRGWFLKPLSLRAKVLDRSLYHEIKKDYLRHSLAGWIFFILPLIAFIILWSRKDLFPVTIKDAFTASAAIVSFILSVLFHLQAFGVSALSIFKKTDDRETARDL